MAENLISISNPAQLQTICGSFDANLKQIEQTLQVSIVCRGETIKITGSQAGADLAEAVLRSLAQLADTGQLITEQTVRYTLDLVASGQGITPPSPAAFALPQPEKWFSSKTVGQQKYVDAIRKNTIVFGIGPAGTGKTYLAVAMAVKAFKRHEVDRIILTRPAVEAGEKLGFLPGDLQNKVDPYLRPLYDGLFEMMGAESFQRHMERGSIEVAPLAYMRGRTLEHAFIIRMRRRTPPPNR
ncbi:MAG: PhoH family protein [Ruminococcus sp.]